MRPRANTISHVDNTTLGILAAANSTAARQRNSTNTGHNHHPSMNNLPGPGGYEFRGMSTATGHHGNFHGLPKLDTQGLNIDISGALHTAPLFGDFGTNFGIDNSLFGPGTTINPAQLHFTDSPHSLAFDIPTSPFHHAFSGIPAAQASLDEDGNFEWIHGFDHQMSFDQSNEYAIAGSSPSAISTGSRSGISEVMLDGSNNSRHAPVMWQNSSLSQSQMAPTSVMDLSGSIFSELVPPGPQSPTSFRDQLSTHEHYFSTPMPVNPHINGISNHYYHPPMIISADTPTNSTASVSSSNRQSSVTSVSTDSITDATRQALIASLSYQPSKFQRQYSQSTIDSPLSPGFSARPNSTANVSLPSTYDLQRYVAAYIQYFHPHLPFLHISSLSFDSPAYTSHICPSGGSGFQQSNITGGGGSLILAMAAIGALYEYENAVSKELFEMAKRMIQLYLEERRKADMSATIHRATSAVGENPSHNTPLWLVQAMLLNVIYGHNCGDKTSAENASTHCAALVSLARAADLTTPFTSTPSTHPRFAQQHVNLSSNDDIRMDEDGWTPQNPHEVQDDWQMWKLAEERKRTLFSVFVLSSILVSAYNHAPALMNSEIRLDLPCDEDLWAADSPAAWYALGGSAIVEQRSTPFTLALSSLLTASQRPRQSQISQPFPHFLGNGLSTSDLPMSDFQPSTFGCLVLINALHNYIWETRQRHIGRQWTTQETESMHAHIEPALAAWQAAWASNPHHSLERPNPFGFGPLSADCIPLLDLAYVRLFVDLGRSKEAFWQRDFEGMADEFARGSQFIQHADLSPKARHFNDDDSMDTIHTVDDSLTADSPFIKEEQSVSIDQDQYTQMSGQSSKRERHLRKAAFHAAHSLALSDKLGVTFADFSSRELPMSSAMCAFDCAQILAEWVSTVQERVGRYLGILGKDEMDFGQVPSIMLLEDEDCKLLEKIDQVLHSIEMKIAHGQDNSMAANALSPSVGLSISHDGGYGAKILSVTAFMLEKAAVWPGKLYVVLFL